MKYIFIGLFYFGWWHGWQAENRVFDTMEECTAYMDELSGRFHFFKKLGGPQYIIKDWDMTCQSLLVDLND